MNNPKETPVVLGMHQFLERFPDETSSSIVHRGAALGGWKAHLSQMQKPRVRCLEASRRTLSVQGLPEDPLGEIRHHLRKKQDSLSTSGCLSSTKWHVLRKGISSVQLSKTSSITRTIGMAPAAACARRVLRPVGEVVGRGRDGCDLPRRQGITQARGQEKAAGSRNCRETGRSRHQTTRNRRGQSHLGGLARAGRRYAPRCRRQSSRAR